MDIGDVVVLKSGGPKMTIILNYNNRGELFQTCWFLDGVIKSADFVAKSLKIVEEEKF